MYLYRISKAKYAGDLSGEGAKKAGGRWNQKGTAVIYTSDSTALATLETLVHSPLNIAPKNRAITVFELPDSLAIQTINIKELPHDWAYYPAPPMLAKTGTDWAESLETSVLKVPSAIISVGESWNYILNPMHGDFRKIKIVEIRPYEFDSRLYQR